MIMIYSVGCWPLNLLSDFQTVRLLLSGLV